MPKKPKKTKLKFLAREYASGEIVLLFPEVSASPDGKSAVAYASTSSFYPVDPEVVVKNTSPLKSRGKLKFALLELRKMELDFTYEEGTGKLAPVSSKEARENNPEAYRQFPRLKHQYS